MIIKNKYSNIVPQINRWHHIVEISEGGETPINAYWKLKPSFNIKDQKEFKFHEHGGVMPLTDRGVSLLIDLPYAYKDNHDYYTQVFCKPSPPKYWGTQRHGVLY